MATNAVPADGMPTTQEHLDFFISRTQSDKDIALAIAEILRAAGHTTWLQDENFGQASFMARMEQGFDSGARVVALLSSGYQRSDYCRKEYNFALTGDPLNLKQPPRLIVLRVEDCAPAGNLRDIAYTDLVPILTATNGVNPELLARVVRVAVGAETHEAEVDFAALYRRAPQQVLHAEINPVPNFTSREAELAALDQALWAEGGKAALTNSETVSAAVHGLGGVGKSMLAREYAWRSRERYRGVWWVRAEQHETLLDDLIELGARFIPRLKEVQERKQAARDALNYLNHARFERPWLIIYDNVAEPAAIDKLTPRTGAHVLITTRWPDWYGHAAELPIDVFTPEVAVDFLMAHARRGDARAAARLATELGHLPLALAHARTFCWGMNWGFDQYHARLSELIRESPRSAAYPKAVFATFSLAIEKVAETAPEAETVMSILAWLAPDQIPLDVISEAVMSELKRDKATAVLAEDSLVMLETLEDGSPAVSIHRLVQEVARGRLVERGAEAEAVAQAVGLVADAFPFDSEDVHYWRARARLLPHALAVLEKAPDTGEAAHKTSLLLNRVAVHFKAINDFDEAVSLYGRALSIDATNLGPEHPKIAEYFNKMALLLQDGNVWREVDFASLHEARSRYRGAEAMMIRRTLPIDERSYPPSLAHDFIPARFGDERQMRGALSWDETNYGPEHPEVAIDLNDVAELLRATNRLAEAEPLYHRAIAIFEKFERDTGYQHPKHARTLFNLTGLLRTRKLFADRIEPMMRNALSIHETSYGPEHPEVAADLNSLARLLQATKRLAEAEPMMRRAFSIDEKVFHPEHPKVARDLNNLAQLLQDTDRLAEAKPLMHRAANVFEQSLGADHPSTRTARENLAVLESEIARTAAGCPAADSASLVPGVTNQSSKPPRPGILARWFGRG